MENIRYRPQLSTIDKASLNYKIYRNTANNFARKIRMHILERDARKCKNCGSVDNLEVDHIKSVYIGFKEKISVIEINNLNNLQLLCKSCNSSKKPER